MDRRIKVLKLSPEALVMLLQYDGGHRWKAEGMPADAKIVFVKMEGNPLLFHIEAFVESSEFPEVPSGEAPPYFQVMFSRMDEPKKTHPLFVGIQFDKEIPVIKDGEVQMGLVAMQSPSLAGGDGPTITGEPVQWKPGREFI